MQLFDENNIFLFKRSHGNAIQSTNATIHLYADRDEVDKLKSSLETAIARIEKLESESKILKK